MYEPCARFAPEFLDELWQRINPDDFPGIYTDPGRLAVMELELSVEMSPVPSREHFESILTNAFWASFGHEEGRSVTFSLAYAEPIDDSAIEYRFEEPIPFSDETLVKLAPALAGSETFGVWKDADNVLGIWGYASLNRGRLRLSVNGPGLMVVNVGRGVSKTVVSGQRAVFVDTSLARPNSPIWNALFSNDPPGDEFPLRKRYRVKAVLSIVRSLRDRSTGGTFLLVPGASEWRRSMTEIKYPALIEFERVPRAFERLIEAEKKLQTRLPHDANVSEGFSFLKHSDQDYQQLRRKYADTLEHVGRVAAVDGATVLDQDLRLLAFGAKIGPITAGDVPSKIRVHWPVENLPFDDRDEVKLGGTRHGSAAQFVYDQRESIAITVSQDGIVTVFWWDTELDSLACLRNAELVFV